MSKRKVEKMTKFLRLHTKAQRERLKYHAKVGTPICCGDSAYDFTDGKGGG